MRYAIYPAIGIVRLGDSVSQFFIGPEIPGHAGVEPDGAGGEIAVREYKHASGADLLVKRQAARFRVFEDRQDGTPPRPLPLPAGARIEWTVHLLNKKAAVVRSRGAAIVAATPGAGAVAGRPHNRSRSADHRRSRNRRHPIYGRRVPWPSCASRRATNGSQSESHRSGRQRILLVADGRFNHQFLQQLGLARRCLRRTSFGANRRCRRCNIDWRDRAGLGRGCAAGFRS